MRGLFAPAMIVVSGALAAEGHAASADLVFCSKLAQQRERLACYDAAARIADNKPARTNTRQPVAAAPESAYAKAPFAPSIAPPPSKFHGGYAALGGSYGWASTRSYDVSAPTSFSDGNGTAQPSGASGVAALGYNITSGQLLFGGELSGRWGDESAKEGSTHQLGSIFEGPVTVQHSYQYRNDASVHLSGRVGMTFEDTLIFGKVGFGATRIEEVYSLNVPGFFSGTIAETNWVPSAIFGVGVEQNIGPVFVRVAGEVEAFDATLQRTPPGSRPAGASSHDGLSWVSRVAAMLGLRF